MPDPRVEFLWWEGCPSWERALAELRAAMRDEGLDPEAVEMIRIDSDADADRESFPGSPTIRVEGADVEPVGAGEPTRLLCRLYRRPDGRASPLPDPDAVRAALRRATTEHAT
jgi:hypothetical protein